MLKDAPIAPTIPASDIAVSKKFYGETLGLGEGKEFPDGSLMFDCGQGTSVLVYPTAQNAGKSPATCAGWNVTDIEAVVAGLTGQGVTFEQYDQGPIKTDAKGIATLGDFKAAWFKDPDGNILAINQM